ncbi:MAG: hypothetical protein ACLSUW_01590 [Akkermansia sp.]
MQNRLRHKPASNKQENMPESSQLILRASAGWEYPVFCRNGQGQRDGPAWLHLQTQRYAEHIEIGKSSATPYQWQPGENACFLKSATISSPEGSVPSPVCIDNLLIVGNLALSLHRKIYFKQTTDRPVNSSKDFRKTKVFLFKNQA